MGQAAPSGSAELRPSSASLGAGYRSAASRDVSPSPHGGGLGGSGGGGGGGGSSGGGGGGGGSGGGGSDGGGGGGSAPLATALRTLDGVLAELTRNPTPNP